MSRFCFFTFLFIILFSNLAAQVNLEKGNLFVYAVNSNVNLSCPVSSINQIDFVDELLLVTLKEIPINTVIYLTDNGWQRKYNNYFGTTEGLIKLIKKTTSMEAGSVFSIKIPSSYTSVNLNLLNPDWECTKVTNGIFGIALIDQIFIFNAGNWQMNTIDNHKGIFDNSTILTAYNNKVSWDSFVDSPNDETTNSGLLGDENDDLYDITDFHLTTNLNSAYSFYEGQRNEVSENEWKLRFLNPTYWKSVTNCTLFNKEVIRSSISINNQDKTYRVCKDSEIKLDVDPNTIVTYQWYQSINEDLSNSLLISGANTSSFYPTTSIVGTFYYFCELTYKLEWISSGQAKYKISTLSSIKFKIEVFENKLTPIEY